MRLALSLPSRAKLPPPIPHTHTQAGNNTSARGRQACRTARRLVHGAVKQHETAQKTHAELETKLAQVQRTSSMPTRAPILTLIAFSSFEPFGQAYHQVEGLETEKAEALKALDSERALSRQNLGALRAALQRADEERKAMDSNEWNLQRATNPAFIEEAIKQWLSAGGRGRPSTLDTAALAGALVLNLVPDVPPYQRRHSMRKRGSDDRKKIARVKHISKRRAGHPKFKKPHPQASNTLTRSFHPTVSPQPPSQRHYACIQ